MVLLLFASIIKPIFKKTLFKEYKTLLQTKYFPRSKESFQRNMDLFIAKTMYAEPLVSPLKKNHDHSNTEVHSQKAIFFFFA